MKLRTTRGYDFFECSSAMQKAIRRGDTKLAGYFALELFHSKYWEYVWKRLLTIAAEDCGGIISVEVMALFESFKLVNGGKSDKEKGRIFISKAVILLCAQLKNRDADHLQNLVYDKKMEVSDAEVNVLLACAGEYMAIPGYAYDVHTQKGKGMGKTKKDFFIDELKGLNPRQPGLFDHLVEKL